MLIFDRFPSRQRAETFAQAVTQKFGLPATVYDSQQASDAVDPFPYQLDPPIVLVERPEDDEAAGKEAQVEQYVEQFGGTFAGT